MPFLDSLDVANRAIQICGGSQILSTTEDSQNNFEAAFSYDKLRRAELRRNVWTFATRKAALRPVDTTTLLIVPSAYDATKTYLPGELVQDTNGLWWISLQADNTNNQPGGNNEVWDMYFGPQTASLFDSTQSYYGGEVVYVVTGVTPNGYQLYLSLITGNQDVPGTATAWVSTTQYKQDDTVTNAGSQWRSLLPVNLNNTPADGAAAWSASTAYTTGNHVTGSDNYIYSATGSTTGNDPTTDGGAHWTNTGTLNAWSRLPTLTVSSVNWRPIRSTLRNLTGLIYPLGSGPISQATTRNVYRLPAGYLRRAPRFEKVPVAPLGGPRGIPEEDWELDGDYIVSADVNPILLRFVADITKVRAMDDMFCEGLACRIATAIAPRITQSEAKMATIAKEYALFMGEARTANSIEQGYQDPPDDEMLMVRL